MGTVTRSLCYITCPFTLSKPGIYRHQDIPKLGILPNKVSQFGRTFNLQKFFKNFVLSFSTNCFFHLKKYRILEGFNYLDGSRGE